MRELVWMCEGRIEYGDRQQWNHTAHVMGIIHNVNATKKKHLVGFDYYNPYIKKKSKPGATKLDKNSIQALKGLAQKGRGLRRGS